MGNPQGQVRKVEVAIERPEDTATREGNIKYQRNQGVTVAAGGANNVAAWTNTSGENEFFTIFTCAFTASTGGLTPGDFWVDLRLVDGSGTVQAAWFRDYNDMSKDFNPSILVPNDWGIEVRLVNNTAAQQQVNYSLTLRGEA